MPQFKTTNNILKVVDDDELFDPNWFDSDKLVLPPKTNWDYARDLQIEDVNIWEVLYSQGGGLGVYASWDPYAEFYMITLPAFKYVANSIETYYGVGANTKIQKRIHELNIKIPLHNIWIEPENMWLYT